MTRIVLPDIAGGLAALIAAGPLRARLEALGEVVIATDRPGPGQLAERLAGADVVVLVNPLPDEVLRAHASTLRLVAFAGTGAASYVNIPLAAELGVTVTNVRHYGDQAVAELAVGLLFAAARNLPASDREVRAGDWSGSVGRELAGSSVAVVGFGGIGRAFARMVHGLGMRVLVWDKVVDPEALAAVDGREVDLDEAFGAETVSIHLPYTEATAGLITARHLDRLPPGAILVNTARGEVLERGALAARLARGDVWAALDVFDPEPLPADDPLLSAPGTVFSPHLGFRTPQAMDRMAESCVAGIEAFLAGTPVNVLT